MHFFQYAVTISAILVAAPMAAQAQKAGITYDCDTATNHYSELRLPAPASAFVVRGNVRLNRIADIDKFAPLTRLSITQAAVKPGEPDDNVAGFELTALPAKALGLSNRGKAVLQFLSWDEIKGGTAISHDPSKVSDYTDSLPFTLAYDGHSVVVRVDGKEQSISLSVKNPTVRLVCSTGEFLYTDLTVEPLG